MTRHGGFILQQVLVQQVSEDQRQRETNKPLTKVDGIEIHEVCTCAVSDVRPAILQRVLNIPANDADDRDGGGVDAIVTPFDDLGGSNVCAGTGKYEPMVAHVCARPSENAITDMQSTIAMIGQYRRLLGQAMDAGRTPSIGPESAMAATRNGA